MEPPKFGAPGGGDVEGVIEDATDHRLSLERAIDIAKETCRGLEFAHSRASSTETGSQGTCGSPRMG